MSRLQRIHTHHNNMAFDMANRLWSNKGILKAISMRCALMLCALLVCGLGCKEQQASKPGAAKATPAGPTPEVLVLKAQEQPVRFSLELPGRTEAFRLAELRPRVNGIIQKRLFTEGATVKAGQLLYQLDSASYAASLENAKAMLDRALAAEDAAMRKAKRYNLLADGKVISAQTQLEVESAWKQAKAETASARAAVEQARINLQYTRISAPISGRIGKSLVSEGALVSAQQASPLAIIQQLDPLYVDLNQPVNEFLELKKQLGIHAAASEIRLILPDGGEYPHLGAFAFSEARAEQQTASVSLRATIPNPEHLLLPGMFIRARLSGPQQLAILAPQGAIVRNAKGEPQLMVVNDKSVVELHGVTTGRTVGGDKVVIEAGLSPGEQVVVAGLQKIRPGAVVKALAQAPPEATPQPSAKQ